MQARSGAPTLSSASVRAAGVAAIRLVLGVGFVAGSIARGLDRGPALLAAVVGAVVLAMIALGPRGRTPTGALEDAVPVPPDARFDPGWLGVLQACVPSTVGVAAMAAVSLVFSTALAALLGGVLLALGGLAAVAWAQLAARERGERRRYWVERGPSPRVFVSSG
jgi:Na+/H+ antiporter NhaD/arsenite permease-like protein